MASEIPVTAALEKYITMLSLPFEQPELIPSLAPLLIGLIIVGVYYGRYRNEELGWGAAVSNSLLLVTTGITLLYNLIQEEPVPYVISQIQSILTLMITQDVAGMTVEPKFLVATGIIGVGAVLVLLDFYHMLPKGVAFFLSSAFTVYTLAYIAVAIVYNGMQFGTSTYIAAGGVIITSFLIVRTIKTFGKTYDDED